MPTIQPDLAISNAGTHLRGYFTAGFAQLYALLGNFLDCQSGDGKITTEWHGAFNGQTWTLYDYKVCEPGLTVEAFRAWHCYEWHIGGTDQLDVAGFTAALEAALTDRAIFVDRLIEALPPIP